MSKPRIRIINHRVGSRDAGDVIPAGDYYTFTIGKGSVSWRSQSGRTGSEPTTAVGEDPEHVLSGLIRKFRLSPTDYEVLGRRGRDSRDALTRDRAPRVKIINHYAK